MDIQNIVIEEANRWFERNREAVERIEFSTNAQLAGDFIEKYIRNFPHSIERILEIGCSYGYNLNYLQERFGVKCDGVEPSDKAVAYGSLKWGKPNPDFRLRQGLSDRLPYDDGQFDVVLLGFSFYITPRSMIAGSVYEADRVLKEGGFLILTDFDTPLRCKRVNIHNEALPVFKEDYAQRFLSMGYTLAEKISYSHERNCFHPDIQERVSTQILYKEYTEHLYAQA